VPIIRNSAGKYIVFRGWLIGLAFIARMLNFNRKLDPLLLKLKKMLLCLAFIIAKDRKD